MRRKAMKAFNEYVNLYEWCFSALNYGFTVRDQEGTLECGDLSEAKVLVAEDGGEPCGRFFVTQVGLPYGRGVMFPSPDAYQEYLAE